MGLGNQQIKSRFQSVGVVLFGSAYLSRCTRRKGGFKDGFKDGFKHSLFERALCSRWLRKEDWLNFQAVDLIDDTGRGNWLELLVV